MKKTFLAKRNVFLSPRSISWGVFAFGFATLFFLTRLLFPNFFWHIVTPFFRASDTLASESHIFMARFNNSVALTDMNEKLKNENSALTFENKTLTQKVAQLSAMLGTSPIQKDISGIIASVVARPPQSPYDTLMLSAGKDDGVVLGMEAFGTNGSPIGIVSSVLNRFSWVTLFSASGMMTSGWVGHANIPLTITGAGGGALSASLARTVAVAVGDTVFAPGPGMLPIGSIVRIDADPLSIGVTLRIMPASNLFSIGEVQLRMTGVSSAFATSTLP